MESKDNSRAVKIAIMSASAVIVIAGIKAAQPIITPFLLAVFIAIIATPMFLSLQRGVPSALALLIMVLALVVVGFVCVGIIRNSLDGLSDNLDKYQLQLEERLGGIWEWAEEMGIKVPDKTISELLNPQVAMSYLGAVTVTLSGLLANTFLILLVVVFILFEASVLPAKVKALPGLSGEMWERLQETVENVRRYMSMKTVTSLMTGVIVTIMAAIIGIDYPVLLGVLAFLLNYVPNIGSFIAAIPGVLLAFIQFDIGWAIVAALGYVAVNVLVGNVIEPRMMGRGLGLSPLVILISMVFWGWVLGPVGMLLSVPATMAAKIAMESENETRWIALLMGSDVPE